MFKSLGHYLGKRLQKYSFGKDIAAQNVIQQYNKWIESKFGDVGVKATVYKNGLLRVEAPNSVMVQELKLIEPQIKEDVSVKRFVYRVSS